MDVFWFTANIDAGDKTIRAIYKLSAYDILVFQVTTISAEWFYQLSFPEFLYG